MKIDFQYTFAEYRDVNRAHLTPRTAAQRVVVLLFLAASFLCLLYAAIGPIPKYTSAATTAPVRVGLDDFAGSLVPYLPILFMVVILVILARPKLSMTQRRFDDLSSIRGSFPPVLLILGAITAAYLSYTFASIRQPTAGAVHTASGSDVNWWLGLIPSFVVLIFIWLFVIRRMFRKNWKLQPALMRHKTLEYSSQGISCSDDLSSSSHKWEAILRCVETTDLFILYPSGMTFIIVPKRAFPSPAAVAEFLDLIREWANSRAVGFPVIPLAPAAAG
jgi:hypothetical protein